MKTGFTLIELLVVVLIIGILAAIALPQYQKAVEKARITEAKTVLNAIAKAETAYYLYHGDFADLETLNRDGDITVQDAGDAWDEVAIVPHVGTFASHGRAMVAQLERSSGRYQDNQLAVWVYADGFFELVCNRVPRLSGEFCSLAGFSSQASPDDDDDDDDGD